MLRYTNATAISLEIARATAADSETLARQQADSQFSTALALEESGRRAGDTALSGLIATNKTLSIIIKYQSVPSIRAALRLEECTRGQVDVWELIKKCRENRESKWEQTTI